MLDFSRGKAIVVMMIVLIGAIFAVPNLMDRDNKGDLPDWWQPVNLGLDLQGGSYLLMEVDMDTVAAEQFTDLRETVRATLREKNIGYRNLAVRGESVTLQLPQPEKMGEARTAIFEASNGVEFENLEDGRLRITIPESEISARKLAALTQSIEIVRRRVDQSGTSEASIQRQGQDRIIVELPGVGDPERLKALIGQTAKMNFHMLAPGYSNGISNAQDLPPGTMLIPDASGSGQVYVVQQRVSVAGEFLVDAQPSFQDGQPVVSFRFNTQGGRRFGAITSQNVGEFLAIVLDDAVISAPRIQSPITGGNGIITGNFTVEGAQDLALLLRAGALPAPITFIEERTVGPGLGADSIAAGEFASVLGLILVAIFMVTAYGLFGVFSVVALGVNLVLILGALSGIGATLTLPGIAGIVLTVGMAVDANVLIYERMREELKTGRTLFNALDSGFKQAFKTILDSNLTTLIAAILLFTFGSGPVKGFAVTLGFGILSTLFTATMVSRLIVISWVRRTKPTSLPMAPTEDGGGLFRPLITRFPQEFKVDFISKRGIALVFSAVLIVASIGSLAVQKLNFGIDFAGGILLEVRSEEPVDVSAVRAQIGTLGLGDVAITTFGDTGRDLSIRIQQQEGGEQAQTDALQLVQETLGDGYENRRTELVGPKVGAELVVDGAMAVGLALLAICIYIWFRFEWQFALGATLALSHDVIATLGLFSIFQLDFNLTTVAAVLTIAGYSINDTVVAYDRVREKLRKYKKLALPDLVNLALNKVLSRTLLTSFTTLLAVMALFIFGGEVLRGFSVALIWGVIIGTYSSIYVAMPVLIYFNLRHEDLEGGASSLSQVPEAERA